MRTAKRKIIAQIELEVDATTAKMWREASLEVKRLVTKYIEDQINSAFDTENEDKSEELLNQVKKEVEGNRLTEEDINKEQ